VNAGGTLHSQQSDDTTFFGIAAVFHGLGEHYHTRRRINIATAGDKSGGIANYDDVAIRQK
jgi:hypothetical protein